MAKYLVFWFVFTVLGRLPVPVLYRIADIVGAISYRAAPTARENVLDNLRHVMPDASSRQVEKTAKKVFRNVAYYWADMAHMPYLDTAKLLKERMVLHGIEERLRPASQTGKGAIMWSAHLGNPEIAGQAMVPLGMHAFALTEPIQPPALARLLKKHREAHGHEFVPVGVGSVKGMLKTLRKGGIVVLLGDRDIEGPKMLLPFFGVETYLPSGPAEVAVRTGAAPLPCFAPRKGSYQIEAWVEEPIPIQQTGDFEADVRAAMLEWVARLEARIRATPEQWCVLERVWDVGPGAKEGGDGGVLGLESATASLPEPSLALDEGPTIPQGERGAGDPAIPQGERGVKAQGERMGRK